MWIYVLQNARSLINCLLKYSSYRYVFEQATKTTILALTHSEFHTNGPAPKSI